MSDDKERFDRIIPISFPEQEIITQISALSAHATELRRAYEWNQERWREAAERAQKECARRQQLEQDLRVWLHELSTIHGAGVFYERIQKILGEP
jgi:hypothetical protein